MALCGTKQCFPIVNENGSFCAFLELKKKEEKRLSCCIPAKSMESPGMTERKMEQCANCRWELRKGQERSLHVLKDLAESLELP